MKKSYRIFITGSIQPFFFNNYIKSNAERLKIRGFLRKLEDGRMEVFIEGDGDSVLQMLQLSKRGAPHSVIRSVEEKEERFQDFKDFKVYGF